MYLKHKRYSVYIQYISSILVWITMSREIPGPFIIAIAVVVALVVSIMVDLFSTHLTSMQGQFYSSWETACFRIKGFDSNGNAVNVVAKVYVASSQSQRAEGFRGKQSIDFLNVNASGMVFLFDSTPSFIRFDMDGVQFDLLLLHISKTTVVGVYMLRRNSSILVTTYSDRDFFIELDPQILKDMRWIDEVSPSVCRS